MKISFYKSLIDILKPVWKENNFLTLKFNEILVFKYKTVEYVNLITLDKYIVVIYSDMRNIIQCLISGAVKS